jgi:hypothetical protein
MPEKVDLSSMWQFSAVHDDAKAKTFEKTFGIKLTVKFRHVPDSFARLLAKIGYCNLLCILDPGDFRPICVPYILGQKSNLSYIVGGNFDIAEPIQAWATYSIRSASVPQIGLCCSRKFGCSRTRTPTYHVVIGDITGADKIASTLKKLGDITVAQMPMGVVSGNTLSNNDHWMPRVWMPRVWPLPFWTTVTHALL